MLVIDCFRSLSRTVQQLPLILYGSSNQFRNIECIGTCVVKFRIFLRWEKGLPARPVSGSKAAKKGRAHSVSNRLLLKTNQYPDEDQV